MRARRTTSLRFALAAATSLAICASCSSGTSGGGSGGATPSKATTSATGSSTSSTADPARDRVQFRPVLAVSDVPACTPESPISTSVPCVADDQLTSQAAGLPAAPEGGLVARGADGTIYLLGPAGFGGSSLATATADFQEDWVVNVRVRGDEVDHANEAFDACYDAADTCPATVGDRGAIAIVFDGTVISAPVVNGLDLASDTFTIAGAFTQSQAEDLAQAATS